MTCPNCKKVYNDHVTICISCGAELVPDPAEEKSEGIFEVPAQEEPPAQRNITVTHTPPPVTPIVPDIKMKKRPPSSAAVIIPVMLFLSVLLFFGSFTLRQLTMEENITRMTESFDLLSLPLESLSIGDLTPADSDQTLGEAVAVMADGSGLDSAKIQTVYESSTIKDRLSRILSQYGRYLRDGTPPETITADTVKELFSENISVVNGKTGYVISESDISLAYTYIDSLSPVIDSFSVRAVEEHLGGVFTFLRAFVSVPVITAELAAAALFIILAAVSSGSWERTLFSSGISLLSAGFVITGAVFMFTMQIPPLRFDSPLLRELIKSISSSMSDSMYAMGVIIALSGLTGLIWSLTLKNRTSRPIVT